MPPPPAPSIPLSLHLRCRGAGSFLLRLPHRASTEFDQKRLAGVSFPVPTEQKFVWKNRIQAHGGFIQQSISFYQLKTLWPFWHQSLMRNWSRNYQHWNMWMWPAVVVYILYLSIQHDVKKYTEDQYWY